MKTELLFIQGGGENGYEADAGLVASLQQALGVAYTIHYPRMHTDEAAPDYGWLKQIGTEIGRLSDDGILVAHSLGASLLLKYLSEHKSSKKIALVFLLATPFWAGNEDWVQGLKLEDNFPENLLPASRFFFYHCLDDQEVPVDHLTRYRHKLPGATFREFEQGGHQLGTNLDVVARDIKIHVSPLTG